MVSGKTLPMRQAAGDLHVFLSLWSVVGREEPHEAEQEVVAQMGLDQRNKVVPGEPATDRVVT